MRKSLITILLLIVISVKLFPQWSTDPNNNLVVAVGWDPHIASDSAGGCYITYNYQSFYPQKLAVERLDKYGYKPWGTRRQILGELPEQWQAEIIEDGEGGVIVSYEDNQVVGANYITRVRVQKVDSNGNFLWGQTGVRVTLEEVTHGAQKLVSDGDGGCVVLWQDNLTNFRINRINRDGQRVWSDTGILIGNGHSSIIIRASDGNYYVKISTNMYRINQNGQIINQYSSILGQPVPDSEGGVVLGYRVWTGQIPKFVAQRKDSLGSNLWEEPYVEIADSLYINTQLKIQFNDGYYFFGWSGTKNGINRIAQFQALRVDGSKLFPEVNISISENTPIGSPIIVPSDSGRTIIIWNDATISSSTIAQMYDTLGIKLWNENGVVVSYPAIAVESTTDGQGGFITMGPINQFTIVAQQVSKYGTLGQIVTSIESGYQNQFLFEATLYQNYPNPFNSSTTIQFQLPKEDNIKIYLYNVLGEKIKTIADGLYRQGMTSIIFSPDNLPSGIYLYKLHTETKSITKKLIIIK